MINFVDGSLFDQKFDIIINTTNCVGIMGKGVALEFKKRYPKMFKEYRKLCLNKKFTPGDIWVWNKNEDHIINFMTKDHWRNPSKYQYIKKGLKLLHEYLKQFNSIKIAIPALGCGHGGLDWKIVSKLITENLQDLNIEIYIFNPTNLKT